MTSHMELMKLLNFFVSYYHSQQEVDYYNCQSDVSGWWVFGLEHKTN